MEDAFEALHLKAETVRNALRQRGAGLAAGNQMRRGGHSLDARLGTPAMGLRSGTPGWGGEGWDMDSGTDGEGVDARSELGPDDSASCVGVRGKRRQGGRRWERRTPALVEEDEVSEL